MACTPCQNLFTLIMENENTYYLLGYDQDMVEETLTLLAEGEKHLERPITTNVMEPVHLLQEKKKGARQATLLNEERKREKVCENKRCSREKKRHLKKLLKMKEVCFLSLQMVTLYVLFVDSLNNHFCVVLHSIVKTTMEVMETRLQDLMQR